MGFNLRNPFAARSSSGAPSSALSTVQALIQQRRLEPALAAVRELLSADPRNAAAWYQQGNVLKDLNRPHEALDSYHRAIRLEPRHAAAHCNCGVVLLALGRPDAALDEFRQAIEIDPHDAIAHFNRGVAEQTLRQSVAALASYTTALDLQPQYAEAYFSRATLYEESARWREALSDYDQALVLRPTLAPAHFHRGNVLARLQRWDDALASFDRALAGDPGNVRGYLHRGNVLRELRRWEAAVTDYTRVIALEPDDADAHYNRAVVFELQKRFPEALQDLDRAIDLRPGFIAAHYNRALVLLRTGEFCAGFANYEWRWKNRGTGFDPAVYHGTAPLWSGSESLEGRRILVFSEQGLGDTLQFCRYLKLLAGLGAIVIFEVQPPLAGLLATIEGAATVLARGEPIPPCDTKCALMSLPLAFKTTVDTIPSASRYLHADAAAVSAWHARLGSRSRPRIGLAWSGNPEYPNDHRRSIPLATLVECLPREFEYFCLQKDLQSEDRATLEANPFIADAAGDLVATAALCECMDVVISVCTSIAHLAGALGRPLWVLLAYDADWRWLEERSDSPWYPTATLYRQTASRDWGGVAARVAADLRRTFAPTAVPTSDAAVDGVSG